MQHPSEPVDRSGSGSHLDSGLQGHNKDLWSCHTPSCVMLMRGQVLASNLPETLPATPHAASRGPASAGSLTWTDVVQGGGAARVRVGAALPSHGRSHSSKSLGPDPPAWRRVKRCRRNPRFRTAPAVTAVVRWRPFANRCLARRGTVGQDEAGWAAAGHPVEGDSLSREPPSPGRAGGPRWRGRLVSGCYRRRRATRRDVRRATLRDPIMACLLVSRR